VACSTSAAFCCVLWSICNGAADLGNAPALFLAGIADLGHDGRDAVDTVHHVPWWCPPYAPGGCPC
jgi:hypothetical protein